MRCCFVPLLHDVATESLSEATKGNRPSTRPIVRSPILASGGQTVSAPSSRRASRAHSNLVRVAQHAQDECAVRETLRNLCSAIERAADLRSLWVCCPLARAGEAIVLESIEERSPRDLKQLCRFRLIPCAHLERHDDS